MKKTATNTSALIKAIDKELKAILENDIRKIDPVKDAGIKNAAFLQLIAA